MAERQPRALIKSVLRFSPPRKLDLPPGDDRELSDGWSALQMPSAAGRSCMRSDVPAVRTSTTFINEITQGGGYLICRLI